MRIEFFRAWHREGFSKLEAKPFGTYCSNLKRVEKNLKVNIDSYEIGELNVVLSKIEKESFPRTSKKVLSDLRSALRKYWEYRKYMRKTFA